MQVYRIRLEEGILQDRDAREEAQDGGINGCSTGGFMVNTGSKNVVQTIIEIGLLLGAGKRDNLSSVKVRLKLLLSSPKGGCRSVVLELFRLRLRGRGFRRGTHRGRLHRRVIHCLSSNVSGKLI